MINLVYIHIGDNLPDYFYDSLYQTLLINNYETKIYIIVQESEIQTLVQKITSFNLTSIMKNNFLFENIINIVPLHILEQHVVNDKAFNLYKAVMEAKFSHLAQFRSGFWISTTSRFFYIRELIKLFGLTNVFHIENDIMMYTSFLDILYFIHKEKDKIWMVKDAPNRVIPSILFFPHYTSLLDLTNYISNTIANTSEFLNDMNILGSYSSHLSCNFPIENAPIIYDGAAFGQYLGGVDVRNLPKQHILVSQFINTTRGFVNETSIVKPNHYTIHKRKLMTDYVKFPLTFYTTSKKTSLTNLSQLANLHIHSKQLYQFSSVFDIEYGDIISGDRILSLCDLVLVNTDILNFHQNINAFAKDIIRIKNFSDVNYTLLNKYFKQIKGKYVKIALYTHMLQQFCEFVLDHLDPSLKYIFYIHNSDHAFHDGYSKLLDKSYVHRVLAQNIDYSILNNKLQFLPIGIANSMWPHGDLDILYNQMKSSYMYKKEKAVYVNINPSTFAYRNQVLQEIQNNFTVTTCSKPYKEYLDELSLHRFCLCVRGNGLDTHRFWEALYLGVIPVIINNANTKMNNFIQYLKNADLPFYEITEDNLCKYNEDIFNDELYQSMLDKHNIFIQSSPGLKLSYYAELHN